MGRDDTTMDHTIWDETWAAAAQLRAFATADGDDTGDGGDGPLAGVRILDLSRLLPGPMATRHLADLDAQVLKVEPPGFGGGAGAIGDDAAAMGAGRESGASYFYRVVNHGKRRLVLDLKRPADHVQLCALAREAHALVEGFRPGVMARLGLSYDALKALNPALVLTSISGYGGTGSQAGAAGHDLNYLAQAGVIDQTRSADGRPAFSHLQIADMLGGAQTAAIGTLAGITGALMSGRGRHVEVSMTDAVRQHLLIAGAEALDDALQGKPARAHARSLLDGGVPCYNLYRCADGLWLAVGALELKFWQALCDAIGRPAWRERHWSLGEAPGSAEALALIGSVAALFEQHDRAHWLVLTACHDCCTTPVLSLREALFGDAPVTLEGGLRRLAHPSFRVRD